MCIEQRSNYQIILVPYEIKTYLVIIIHACMYTVHYRVFAYTYKYCARFVSTNLGINVWSANNEESS